MAALRPGSALAREGRLGGLRDQLPESAHRPLRRLLCPFRSFGAAGHVGKLPAQIFQDGLGPLGSGGQLANAAFQPKGLCLSGIRALALGGALILSLRRQSRGASKVGAQIFDAPFVCRNIVAQVGLQFCSGGQSVLCGSELGGEGGGVLPSLVQSPLCG